MIYYYLLFFRHNAHAKVQFFFELRKFELKFITK